MEETKTQTREQTPPYHTTTMTSPLLPVINPHHCSHQISDRARVRCWGRLLYVMFQGDLELVTVFEDHGVCSGVITDSFAHERTVCERSALVQPLPSVLQLVNRRRRSFPGRLCCYLCLPAFKFWAWYTFGPTVAPTLSNSTTSLPWPPPSTCSTNCILCRNRSITARFPNCSLQSQNFSPGTSLVLQPPHLLAVPSAVPAGCAHHTAEAHVQYSPFSMGSTASYRKTIGKR